MRVGAQTWVGIDPGADALRAVAVCGSVVQAVSEVPLSFDAGPHSPVAVARLAESLQRQGVGRDARAVIIPPELSIAAAVLELPPRSSGAPLEMLAATEIARGREGGAVEVGVFELPAPKRKSGGATEYLVVSGGREPILEVTAALEQVGIIVEAVDTPTTSLARGIGTGARVLAELGASSIRLHICEDDQPRFCYVSQFSRGELVEARLIEELDRCAAYASGRFSDLPLNRVILTGPLAREPGMAEAVRREFDATVVVWSGELAGRGAGVVLDPAYAQALALTTWADSRRVAEVAA
ncbi:MAG: hypothetical protein ACTS22_04995 [Phycisphaerales bacterium]